MVLTRSASGGAIIYNSSQQPDFYKAYIYHNGKWQLARPFVYVANMGNLADKNSTLLNDKNGTQLDMGNYDFGNWRLAGSMDGAMIPFIPKNSDSFNVNSGGVTPLLVRK